MTRWIFGHVVLLATLAGAQPMPVPAASDVPDRPEELIYDELSFEVPDGDGFRHVLSNGIPVYLAEDHTFPLVSLRVLLRQGSYLEPPDKVGLASLTGSMMRSGGTEKMTPDTFDEEVEFLASIISTFGGDSQAGASLRCITPELDASVDLFFDVLRTPRFDEGRLAIEKRSILEAMRQRNDDADGILRAHRKRSRRRCRCSLAGWRATRNPRRVRSRWQMPSKEIMTAACSTALALCSAVAPAVVAVAASAHSWAVVAAVRYSAG